MIKEIRVIVKESLRENDISIQQLCQLLYLELHRRERKRKYAPAKEVLALVGRGALLATTVLIPNSPKAFASFLKESPDYDIWKHYNAGFLRQTLRRLYKQHDIEVKMVNGQDTLSLSSNGKGKILHEAMNLLQDEKPSKWDGKWRLVLYDIPQTRKNVAALVRSTLKMLGFYQLQESVYLFPYPCYKQTEYLRSLHGLGDKIQYMVVDQIEYDKVYKTYFNLT